MYVWTVLHLLSNAIEAEQAVFQRTCGSRFLAMMSAFEKQFVHCSIQTKGRQGGSEALACMMGYKSIGNFCQTPASSWNQVSIAIEGEQARGSRYFAMVGRVAANFGPHDRQQVHGDFLIDTSSKLEPGVHRH